MAATPFVLPRQVTGRVSPIAGNRCSEKSDAEQYRHSLEMHINGNEQQKIKHTTRTNHVIYSKEINIETSSCRTKKRKKDHRFRSPVSTDILSVLQLQGLLIVDNNGGCNHRLNTIRFRIMQWQERGNHPFETSRLSRRSLHFLRAIIPFFEF